MTKMMVISLFLIFPFFLLYVFFILKFTFGWICLHNVEKTIAPTQLPCVSIIVIYRNESHNISTLLHSLEKLNYPPDKFEIVFVDDHSFDNTSDIISAFFEQNKQFRVQLLALGNDIYGKKQGIEKAVYHASYSLIACTDADCIVPENWLYEFVNYYNHHQCRLLSAPIALWSSKTLLEQMQQLEFGSLIATAAGAIAQQQPIMCNGANLFFEKEMYFVLHNEIRKKYHLFSGDDIFLLQACKKHYGATSVGFVKSRGALVQTLPLKKVKDVLSQRTRWGAKTKFYTDRFTQLLALCVAVVSCSILILFVLSCFKVLKWQLPLLLFVLKFLTDFPIMASWTNFIQQKRLLFYYPITAVIYPFYIVIVVCLMFFKNNTWKFRPLSKKANDKNATFAQ